MDSRCGLSSCFQSKCKSVTRIIVPLLINILAWSPVSSSALLIVPLANNWRLSTEYERISIPNQTLPIGTYSALENNGFAGAVYDSYNDVNLRWIARRNWTFELEFPTPTFDTDSKVILTFLGIDTVSTIRLNDAPLGRTDNMFVRYSFDVKSVLKSPGESNSLWVEIQNPMNVAQDLARNNPATPPNCPPRAYNGECHMNFLRKMQASFAWDWGLAAPSQGLWKGVQLEIYDVAMLRDTTVEMELKDGKWNVRFQVYLEAGGGAAAASSRVKGELEVLLPGIDNLRAAKVIDEQADARGEVIVELAVSVTEEQVELWWPNGFGKQPLYTVNVSFTQHDNEIRVPAERDTKTLRIGFRTINLIQTPLADGLSFHFEVNGHAIFMKGSNWIPANVLPDRGADVRTIKYLLTAARDAHMNMLRVWGGGVYESDYFYELADEYGILIWQDLMFACAMYPVYDAFLASVRTEVRQNTRRLQHHPSVAIFVTNNENEVALAQNWYGTAAEAQRFRDEYRKLYIEVVQQTVAENDKWRTCLSSSPSNGLKAINDSYISDNPQDNHYGDIHYYNYFADGWSWSIYPRPRFASEYGFQSYPALSSWGQASGGNDHLPDLINHRQHSPQGEIPILLLINKHLPLDNVPPAELIPAKIYFSQIGQAMTIKTETELYRTLRGSSANTMGALYWQLNDVWVAPSWSGIDYFGKFKILQYYAKKFFAPTSIVPILTAANVLEVHVVNDKLAVDEEEYQVVMRLFNWAGLESRDLKSWPIKLPTNGAVRLDTVPLWKVLNASVSAEEHFLQFLLIDNQQQVVSSNYLFPTPIKKVKGVVRNEQPEVTIVSNECDPTEQQHKVTLRVTTRAPVLFFYIDILNEGVEHYLLSDNGFTIVEPTTTLTITYPSAGCSVTRLALEDLRVYTVNQYMH